MHQCFDLLEAFCVDDGSAFEVDGGLEGELIAADAFLLGSDWQH